MAQKQNTSNQLPVHCQICDKVFSKRSHIYEHLREVHRVEPQIRGKLKCPLCPTRKQTYRLLRSHISLDHVKIQICENLSFSSMEAFEEWKNKIEEETNSKYVKGTGFKPLASGVERKVSYVCHRSGFYNSHGTGKRLLKSQGSCKINATCPSTIDTVLNVPTGMVQVLFWKTHVGHTANLEHLYLTPEDQDMIAAKIAQGESNDKILSDIRNTATAGSQKFKRLQLVTRTDIRNIKRNLQRLEEGVITSIGQWVQEMMELGDESPVLFYKPKGSSDPEGILEVEDIILIIMTSFQQQFLQKFGTDKVCVDGMHGTDVYSFDLISLLTMDDRAEGWPVAFCVTNRLDEKSLIKFFSKVRENCGNIACNLFMTVDSPYYFNSWCTVMTVPQKILINFWHVERNWRKQLLKTNCSSEKCDSICNKLKTILVEQNAERFEHCLMELITEFSLDEETREFAEHFQNNYSNNVAMWAFFERLQLDVNVNVFLESFHKAVEYIYLQGKKNKRLDTCIHALVTLSRDKIFDRLVQTSKIKLRTIVNDIHAAHRRAKLYHFSLIESSTDEKMWEVKSFDGGTKTYHVTLLEETCTCEMKCKICDVCIHAFSCTCAEHLVTYNMCEHIHACLLKDKLTEWSMTSREDENMEEIIQQENFDSDEDDEPMNTMSSINVEQKSEDLQLTHKKMELLSRLLMSVTSENIKNVNKHLDSAINELRKGVPSDIPIISESSMHNFLSITRKSRNTTANTPNPTVIQQPVISVPENMVLFLLTQ